MIFMVLAAGYCVFLFLGMVLCLDLGRWAGARRHAKDPEGARQGLGSLEGTIFALLGLLIAFTFSGAASRFDARKGLMIDEVNAISTANLRLDLLPQEIARGMRAQMRGYVDHRLRVFQKVPDMKAVDEEIQQGELLQREMWMRAVEGVSRVGFQHVAFPVLGSLNTMFDLGQKRNLMATIHPPLIIHLLLGVFALLSSLMAGYGFATAKQRAWAHILGFSAILSLTVFVILDLEYPRVGFIRIESFDKAMIDLGLGME